MIGTTEEDKDIVLAIIVNQMVIEVLERDHKALQESKLKIKEPYLELVDKAIDKAIKKRTFIKKQMGKNGIKVFPSSKVNEDFTEFPYLVRGYQHVMRLLRYALRNYVKEELKLLFND